jgi:hypothetical protein
MVGFANGRTLFGNEDGAQGILWRMVLQMYSVLKAPGSGVLQRSLILSCPEVASFLRNRGGIAVTPSVLGVGERRQKRQLGLSRKAATQLTFWFCSELPPKQQLLCLHKDLFGLVQLQTQRPGRHPTMRIHRRLEFQSDGQTNLCFHPQVL